MSYRLYSAGNMIAFLNTTLTKEGELRVERLPKNKIWYEFDNTASPILYSLYFDNPERDLIIDEPYTAFQKQDGTVFESDVQLTAYLDNLLGTDIFNTLINNGQVDGSGRIRVSEMNTQLDIKLNRDTQPLLVDYEEIGTGTATYDNSDGIDFAAPANSDAVIAQSFQRATYYSGKSHFGELTFDGMDGTEYAFVIQKAGTEKLNVTQSQWNIDTFQDFDPDKFNVMLFQFLYLGGTAVRLGFIRNGFPFWVHAYVHAGLVAGTFIKTPNQPIRYELRKDSEGNVTKRVGYFTSNQTTPFDSTKDGFWFESTGGTASMKMICAQIASEGGKGEAGIPSTIYTTQTLSTAGTEYIVLAFRLKDAYHDVSISQESIGFNATTADNFQWFLVRNPTFASTPTFTGKDNTALELYAGTIVATARGYEMQSDSEQGNSSVKALIKNKLRPGVAIDGTEDIFAIIVKPKSNNLTLDVHINLIEER